MLAGPDPLVILYMPCDSTQDDLLHQLPRHRDLEWNCLTRRITESQNRIGWKRPLRSSSPTVNLTLPRPPLHHVPKHLIQMSSKYLQGWRLNHFPGQPVPMLDNPFSEVKFPNIQSKPPMVQREAISSHPIPCYLGEEIDPHLSTTSFQVVVESNKVSPEPPFLQAKQPQWNAGECWPVLLFMALSTLPSLLPSAVDLICIIEVYAHSRDHPSLEESRQDLFGNCICDEVEVEWVSPDRRRDRNALVQRTSVQDIFLGLKETWNQVSEKVMTNTNLLFPHSKCEVDFTESQNRIGWKRPLRSSSPTVNLTLPRPPLHHVHKHLIQTSFKYFQGCLNLPWRNLRPFPLILSLVTWEERLTPTSLQPPFSISLVVRGPKLNTVFEVRPHQWQVQGHNHFPSPAGHTISDTSQDAIGLLGHMGTLLAHIQPAISQPITPALHGVVVAQVQDPALSLVEPHTIGLSPSIQPVQVPLQSLPSLKQINTPTQLGVVCKLTEGALDPLVQIIDKDIKQDWPQHRALGDIICDQPPTGVNSIHHHSLGPAIQPVLYPVKSTPIQAMSSQFLQDNTGYPTASPSLPIPPEEFIAIHHCTPVVRVIPPYFHDGNHIIVFLVYNGFQLLLFVAHAACIGVEALQLAAVPVSFIEEHLLCALRCFTGVSLLAPIISVSPRSTLYNVNCAPAYPAHLRDIG
ncbi:hypothetical protein QYF61_023508 [Mycteria americana]|uniref:Uncharacterized protein n=1 Tax=Mycteria americana TaxID=33587 RepID=A0AAN7Q7Y0_MYCAM|nr:hypothetical protein QYF61_023508 [Mycteria americana]